MTVDLRRDDGQILPLALAFMVFFSLVITAMLTLANASVLATERLREQRTIVYAADGTMDGAIQYARTHPAAGAFGASPCITFSATLGGVTETVTCVSLANPIDLDRTVVFTTSDDGSVTASSEACPAPPSKARIVAKVIFHDGSAGGQPHLPTSCRGPIASSFPDQRPIQRARLRLAYSSAWLKSIPLRSIPTCGSSGT